MTPADHLATLARQAGQLAAAWPAWWRDNTAGLPDGWSNKTPGSGLPGGGSGISDPTGSAVERRFDLTVREGVDRPAQVHRLIGHLLELTLAMQHSAIGHAPRPTDGLTDGTRLAWTVVALDTCTTHVRTLGDVTVIDDGEPVTMTRHEAMVFCASYLARLGRIIPAPRSEAKFDRAELCHGGVSRGHLEPWGRACSRPAVTRDGLCDTCRRRRDYHLNKMENVA